MDVRRSAVTDEGWELLLDFLGGSREAAARRYEESRRRLCKLFAWKGLASAEDLADETLDRVARKLAAGEQVRTAEAERYIAGVARLVAFEAARAARREAPLVAEPAAPADSPAADAAPADEGVARCLDECLEKLPPQAKQLLLGYHVGQGGARIASRKRIAAELGIALNALRIRVHRLRHEVETCVARCQAARAAGGSHA